MGWEHELQNRLLEWRELLDLGLKTTSEKPEPTRSDCHAWSAHPLFHSVATLLGIRPASPGFRTVEIRPLLGNMKQASGSVPHPRGEISASFRQETDGLYVVIELPQGISGTLISKSTHHPLAPGRTELLA